MSLSLINKFKSDYEKYSTQELISILEDRNTPNNNYTDEVFTAIHEIITDRGEEISDFSKDSNSDEKLIVCETPFKEGGDQIQESQYKTTLAVSQFVMFIGWFVVAVGVIASLIGLTSSSNYGGTSFLAMMPGLGIATAGLFLVMGSQVTKATVDNADHTREILKTLRKQEQI